MGLLSSIGKGIAKGLDVLTVSLAHPIQTATAVVSPKTTVNQVVQAHFAQPLGEQIKDIVLGTASIAATVVGGAAVGGAAKAGTLLPKVASVAKTLIPTTLKGKAIAAVAAPVVIGAVASQPLKSIQAVAKTPGALVNVGGNVANLIAEPSLANAKTLISENPIIVGGAAAAAAIVGAKTIIPAITTGRLINATQEQTEAIEAATAGITVVDKSAEFKTMPYVPATEPSTPKTETIKEGVTKPSTKRRKRVSKSVMPSVNQRVNVIVSNKSLSTGIRQTHKYLNREILV